MKKILFSLGILFMAGLGFAQEPAIIKGLSWLNVNQDEKGCWGTLTPSPFKDTCVVLDTLHYLGITNIKAISWVAGQDVEITDYLSRKIRVLAEAGSNTSNLIGSLTSYQNNDGGFGGYKDWVSDALDTTLALQAFKVANYSNNAVIEPALYYLLSNQNTDGGWSFTKESGSSVYLTSLVLLTLNQYRKDYYLEETITKASNWLITQTPESLWEKAILYSSVMRQDLLEYILSNQQTNGSWDNDAFTTALCLRDRIQSTDYTDFADFFHKNFFDKNYQTGI